ncbi:MAG: tetratricopeptide repeat protein [Terriglobales bacterium]
MPNHPADISSEDDFWQPKVVYGMATACLILGLSVGYLLRGSGSHAATANPTNPATVSPHPVGGPAQMPTLEQMKQMADKKAEPLLEQLKKDPKNKDLLLRVAYFYKSAHQFKEAAGYFDQSLQLDPKNVAARTEKASCLYYDGDVEGALAELQQSLKVNPKDANALFNLGMIRLKGKQDPAGAIAAWQELLKTNPGLDKKPIVEQMIAEARQQKSSQ